MEIPGLKRKIRNLDLSLCSRYLLNIQVKMLRVVSMSLKFSDVWIRYINLAAIMSQMIFKTMRLGENYFVSDYI